MSIKRYLIVNYIWIIYKFYMIDTHNKETRPCKRYFYVIMDIFYVIFGLLYIFG